MAVADLLRRHGPPFCSGAGKSGLDLFGRPRFGLAVVHVTLNASRPFSAAPGVFRI